MAHNSKCVMAGLSLILVSQVGVAQEGGAAPQNEKRANRMLEEVVVTAQKREENLQEVPISISAFSPAKLDAFGIDDIQDLERITPGLTITNSAGYSLAYLRGVGTDAFLPGADSSVPFYIDGVALIGSQGSQDTLGRVERVEVLKGPQGTLFGRNATGGAVNIITPNPSDEFTGDIKVELAEYDEQNVTAYINVPIVDGVAMSVAAYDTQRDNYIKNTAGPVIDIYSKGWRAKLRWDITDRLAIMLSASNAETSNNAAIAFENTLPAPRVGGVALTPADPKADRTIQNDALSGAQNEHELYSATLTWNTDWVDYKLIVSDQTLTAPFIQADFDASALPLVNFFSVSQVAEQQTAELQILSNDGTPWSDKLEWVAGLYYIEGFGGFDPLGLDVAAGLLSGDDALIPIGDLLADVGEVIGLPANPANIRILTGGLLDSQSFSTYFQGTYALATNLDLTLGLRYQEETRVLRKSRMGIEAADGSEFILREDDVPDLTAYQWSPRIALSWFPGGGDTQIYTSIARAYKSPTYNTVNLTETPSPVQEETVTSAELGLKTTLFDGGLTLNTAVFHTKQEDLLTGIVAVTSGGIVSYDNAGEAEISGWEMDFLAVPMPKWNPGLVVTGAVTYLDTEYTDYPDGRGFDDDTGLAFGDGSTNLLPPRDFSGNRIVRTPELTYTIGVNQTIDLGADHGVEVGADAYYNDGFFFLPQNSDLYARESYTLVNARVSYFYYPWDLQITAFGENITDVVYNEAVFVADLGRNQILNAPPVYGLRLNWTY
ncbi:TonB-dependent receptor [Spongiibacter taiwanensis]|uniref:TonB-dependent receptor n=1 Tax=Spongiibacter taiwanensis TaxID=1748242 RepID=UPI00203612B6|nr:TonB-dependent receptor [Spongiibacter taiwanensis]USA42660.1 TonB-dependent receptor [Spongiibacter taiwanensis]